MRSGSGGDEGRRDPRTTKADVAQAEDFLFHLHRGSEFLLKNRVLEAKEELERALQHQPQDAKSQDLLAGVYFRLGVYPRAIEIWSSLVAAYPADVALRVNLALAYFKTGQSEDALDHVMGALRMQPDHERAWGYLGLVHWRRGHVQEARDAFLRAGQASMARRMEEILAEDANDAAAAARHRDAADDAARAIEDGPAPRSLLPPPPVPSTRSLPPPPPPQAPEPVARIVDTVADLVGEIPAAPSEGSVFARGDDGRLFVRVSQGLCVRGDYARSVVASAPGLPVHRRVGGLDATAVLGGDRPMHRFAGNVDAILEADGELRLQVLRVSDGPLFVLESRIVAFATALEIECSTLPLSGGELSVVRFAGEGEVVLRVDAGVRAMTVQRGREARVSPLALVGWSGAILVTAATGVSALSLVLRGEGAVLLA